MSSTAYCAPGAESILAQELERAGATYIEKFASGVRFEASDRTLAYAVMNARVATSIAVDIRQSDDGDGDAVAELGAEIDRLGLFSEDDSVSVRVSGRSGEDSPHFLRLRLLDGVRDSRRARGLSSPTFARDAPDVVLHLALGRFGARVSLELGSSMHRRGYRERGAPAPLRETLAAAVLLDSGYDGTEVLWDPMCGSGTLAIEAAMIRDNLAPGLLRRRTCPRTFSEDLWNNTIADAEANHRPSDVPVLASDIREDAVGMSRRAAKRAGVDLKFSVLDFKDAKPGSVTSGMLVTNPPYGERVGSGSEVIGAHEDLADIARQRFLGWSLHVITGSEPGRRAMRLRSERSTPISNGALECRIAHFQISTTPVSTEPRPVRRGEHADVIENRLKKNRKKIEKVMKRDGIEAYRLYDRDVPEFRVALDRYGDSFVLQEFAPSNQVDPLIAAQRVTDAKRAACDLFGLEPNNLRHRIRAQAAKQYERHGEGDRFLVQERQRKFWVDLDSYLDTGLFLELRSLRDHFQKSGAFNFLNLYGYTCTAGVAAALGGAQSVNVDVSKTYLAWGEENFHANNLDPEGHRFVCSDVMRFLRDDRGRYDLIFAAPPTFSKSARANDSFDVQRDHPELLDLAMKRLSARGEIIFVTHARRFVIHQDFEAAGFKRVDKEFAQIDCRSPHQVWRFIR